MPNRRPKVPAELAHTVLYKAAHACCVCRNGHTRVQLHHIDGNPANNIEANLIALCMPHHDEAERAPGLTRSLDAATLRDFKGRWELEVQELARERVSASNRSSLEMRQWNYFDFPRLKSLAEAAQLNMLTLPRVALAIQQGILNGEGLPADQPLSASAKTVFDAFSYEQSNLLHAAYTELVERVLIATPPVQLKWGWGRTQLRRLAERAAIVYVNRAFRFTVSDTPGRRECRVARYTKGGIQLQFVLDTWSVYSTSALTLHFTGYHRIGAVLLLRSAEINVIGGRKRLTVNATPLVCGMGFPPDIDYAPAIAFRDEDNEEIVEF